MFQRQICEHPDVGTVEYSPHAYLETQHWLKAARLLELKPQAFYGHEIYKTYKSKKTARLYTEDLLRGNSIDIEQFATDDELVFDGWDRLCQKYAKPVFFEKSPQHLMHWGALSLLLDWAESTSIRVKFIGLVRNPHSVIYSSKKLFRVDPVERQMAWAEASRNLLAFESLADKSNFLLIKYEEIIANPEKKFEEVFNFIGLDSGAKIPTKVHTSSKQLWKDDLNYGVQLDRTVSRIARKFQYEREELDNSDKPVLKDEISLIGGAKRFIFITKNSMVNRYLKPLKIWWKSRSDV